MTVLGLSFVALTTTTMLGCFPTLPPDGDADADGRVDSPAETSVDDREIDADETTASVPDVPTVDVNEVTATDVEPDLSVVADAPDSNEPEVAEPLDAEVVEPPTCATDSDCPDSQAPCSLWSCDEGSCVENRADDGVECDDGDLCTDNDACVRGTCEGTPRVCEPSSECVEAAGCFSGTGQCIEVPVSDSRGCDDKDSCTTNDTCIDGLCVGGPPPSATADLALLMGTDDSMWIFDVVSTGDGSVQVIAGLPRPEATNVGTPIISTPSGSRGLGFMNIAPDASEVTGQVWAAPLSDETFGPYGAYLGVKRSAGESFTMSGHYSGAFSPLGDSRLIGEPIVETDFSIDGLYVARLGPDLTTSWAATVQGTFEENGIPVMNGLMGEIGRDLWRGTDEGGGLLVVHMGTPKRIALVDALSNTQVIDATDRETDTLTMLWWLSESGVSSELGRLTAQSGRFVVRDATILGDGTRVVAGIAENGTVMLETSTGVHTLQASANTAVYGWVVALAADGSVRWSRSFRVPAGATGAARDDVHIGVIGALGTSVAVAIHSERNPVVTGLNAPTVALNDTMAVAEPLPNPWTVAQMNGATGALEETFAMVGEKVWLTAVAGDDDGIVVAGRARAIDIGGIPLTNISQFDRPFAARLGKWTRWLGWRPVDDDPQAIAYAPELSDQLRDLIPFVRLDADGVVTAWVPIWEPNFEMGPERSAKITNGSYMQGVGIARFNTNHSVDCAAD